MQLTLSWPKEYNEVMLTKSFIAAVCLLHTLCLKSKLPSQKLLADSGKVLSVAGRVCLFLEGGGGGGGGLKIPLWPL